MNLERLKTIHNGEKVQPTFSVAGDGAPAHRPAQGHGRQRPRRRRCSPATTTSSTTRDFLFTSFGRHYALVVTQDDPHHGHGEHRRRHALAAQLRRQHRLHRLAAGQLRATPCQQVLRQRAASAPAGSASRTTTSRWTLGPRSPAPFAGLRTGRHRRRPSMRQRMIKSAEEIEVIKHGARIGDLGGEAIRRRPSARASPKYEVALDRHRGDGPRDRPDLPGRRTARHLGVVPVRHQHRRRPQLGHHPQGPARTTSCR